MTLLTIVSFNQTASAELAIAATPKANAVTDAADLGVLENGLGLKVGEKVPAFESDTYAGENVTSAELMEMGPLMVIFYRGGWCPFCNFQVRQITQAFSQFQERQVTSVLISVDKTDGAMLVKEAYDIPFPILSDSNLAAHQSFNTIIELDSSSYEKYKKFGVDLEAWSGLEHHKMSAPAIFLIDKDSQVLWSHVALDYKTRPSVEQLLGVIDANLK
ncbi:MAG: redoxin domain-containing protein [Gammaproteobacteria bacterium]|nr:redoxin domain-containing protein [Gammaproteobacteria bacterium]